jgi:tetratricopeptide (TPR) repeat protein
LPAWWRRHLPVVLAAIGYLLVRKVLFGCATATLPVLRGGGEPMTGYGRDLLTHLCTMATLLPRALAQCVVPIGLSLDPPVHYVRSPGSAPVVCGVLFVATLTWLGLRGASRDPARRIGVALAWVPALPWVVLALNLPYLEHRMYAPLVGVVATVAAAGAARCGRGRPVPKPSPIGRLLVASLLAVCVVLASRRSYEYRDPSALWQREVDAQPGSVRALCGRALCAIERGDLHVALPLVQRAVALWPRHVAALRNLAELNLKLAPAPGNAMTALFAADALVAMAPRDPFDRLLRSRALALVAETTGQQSFYDEAEAEALVCLEIAPPKALVYRTAASARTRQGDHKGALGLLDASIAAGLAPAPVWLDRAACLRSLGRDAEADRSTRQAIGEDPFHPAVLEFMYRAAPAK